MNESTEGLETAPTAIAPDPTVAERVEPGAATARPWGGRGLVIALAGVVVAAVFFAAYAYAVRSAPGVAASGGMAECSGASAGCGDDCGGTPAPVDASCGDCGGGDAAWTEPPAGTAVAEGGIQRIAVDVADGYFDPTVIELAAGVPTQIVFGEGQGCLAAVRFPQFGIERDLTAGGATVEIPALQAGEYPFSCGMEMVYGVLVVR